MAKDKLRLILGRVDPNDKVSQGLRKSLDLDHLMNNLELVDNIYEISKKRYLTRAEARSFSELAARIENDLNNIIFIEYSSLSRDIGLFIALTEEMLSVMKRFSERQSRVQHCHRIPIVNIPRLKAYHSIATRIKERMHSLYMETDNGRMEGLRALRSEYFSRDMHDLGNMLLFGKRHLTDAVGIINAKNEDDETRIMSESRKLKRQLSELSRINTSVTRNRMNDDVERLNMLYDKLFEDEESIFTLIMDRMSYSRHSVKELAKVQHYLQNMVKEVARKSKTRIPSQATVRKKTKKLSGILDKNFSDNMKLVSEDIKKTISMITLLKALSSNTVAQRIYRMPRDQHRVEFRTHDDERELKRIFDKVRKLAEQKGSTRKIEYKETDEGNSFSRTFKGNILVLDDSSFISFYHIGREKHVRFALVFNNAIVLGHGQGFEEIKLEWMNSHGKEEVRGDYTQKLSAFLEAFLKGSISKDKEWVEEISGMLVSSYLENVGHSPNSKLLKGMKDSF
ncbi:MAG: hypothetical protein ACLFSL_02535 [Candidatus Woesearchaeota archaeon]